MNRIISGIRGKTSSNKFLRILTNKHLGKILLYKYYQFFNKSFTYALINNTTIKLLPKGQIAKGIFLKLFEKDELYLYQKFIVQEMNVIDAGANIGLYSVIGSKLVGSKGMVVSFEPSKETYQRLTENINLNNLNNVSTYNMGLGDTIDEKLHLRQDIDKGDAERYIVPKHHEVNTEMPNVNSVSKEEGISLDTLDNVLSKIPLKKVDFIKIDTEGFEYYILKGAKETISNNPQIIIMMECTHAGTTRANTTQQNVIEWLKDLGLKIFYRDCVNNKWGDDEKLAMNAEDGMIWACKDISQLKSRVL